MQNNSSHKGLYISDFHRQNSMAAQWEALRMSLHPYSREQKLQQIEMLHLMSANLKERSFATPEIYLSDLHDENVIRSKEGNIFVVDCDIRINTPNLRCGGVRCLTTEVEIMQ